MGRHQARDRERIRHGRSVGWPRGFLGGAPEAMREQPNKFACASEEHGVVMDCLLYTSDAADDTPC
eukprot:6360421-Pyramimonas_sp.AAC.1